MSGRVIVYTALAGILTAGTLYNKHAHTSPEFPATQRRLKQLRAKQESWKE